MTVADTINLCRLAEWLEKLALHGTESAGWPTYSKVLDHVSSIRAALAEIDRLKARVAELDGPFRLSGEPLPEHLSRPLSRQTIRLAVMLHDLPVEVADPLAERLIEIVRNTPEAPQ